MKILHAVLSQDFYDSERYCIELATAQARAGHQIEVLIQNGSTPCARACRHAIKTANEAITQAQAKGGIALDVIPNGMPAWLQRPFARRTVAHFAPDIVHTHLSAAARRVGREAKRLGIPHIATLHGHYNPREHAACDGLIAVACWQTREIEGEFRGPVAVVWPWLPVATHTAFTRMKESEIAALRAHWKAPKEAVVFASIGRLVPEAGMDILVRAFRRAFARDQHSIRLIIAGDGPQRTDLQRLMAGDERIMLITPPPELALFYRAIDVYASTARLEPFGLAVLEAMNAGLPLVLMRTEAPREFVKDARVAWAALHDEEDLARRLREATAWQRRRLSYDLSAFTRAPAIEAIDALYRSVLARKGRPLTA